MTTWNHSKPKWNRLFQWVYIFFHIKLTNVFKYYKNKKHMYIISAYRQLENEFENLEESKKL